MGEASFFEKGVAIIQEATTLDQGRQFEDALAKYELGIKYLLTHLKCTPVFSLSTRPGPPKLSFAAGEG